MRIEYRTSGGLVYLPGLQKPVQIDADQLDPAARDELQRLVQAAGFFSLPPVIGAVPAGSADHQVDTLHIEDDGRSHTVRLQSLPGDGPLHDLLQAVRAQVKAQRAAAKRGP